MSGTSIIAKICMTLTPPLSEGLHISFYSLYNAVSGNYSLQNSPLGEWFSRSRPISCTLIQFLLTMSWLRISYVWHIHSQFEHGCDLDFR